MQTFTWYRQRLGRMGPAEIGFRIRSALSLPWDMLLARTAQSVSTETPQRQVSNLIQRNSTVDAAPYVEEADRIADGYLTVFGREVFFDGPPQWNVDPKTGTRAPLDLGRTIDYRDEQRVGDIKYLWEPNRHLHLVTLAQVYVLTGNPRYAQTIRAHLESWLEQCPYLRGVNWASSLELGIRLINWSLVWELVGTDEELFAGADGRTLKSEWLASIYRHMSCIASNLSRYSSANNHLIGEAAGLYVGAVNWPLWPECRRFEELSASVLEQECRRQVSADGVHREQAFSYAQFVLDFFLLAALKGRANGREFSAAYWRRLESMLEFLAAVMDAKGHVPQVGDADDGYVVRLSPEPGFCPFRSLLATGALLFSRPEFKFKSHRLDDKTRWLLGPSADRSYAELATPSLPLQLPRAFPDGGYVVIGHELDTPEEVRILVDTGPLGYLSLAAHGHADALSILVSIRGREILVDPGTFAYHTHPEWRSYFRGTAAHNTVAVDGFDQSVPGGNFMWVQHAPVELVEWSRAADEDRVVALHRGYERLSDPVMHRRAVRLVKHRERIDVSDFLFCADEHVITRRWHFSEDCKVSLAPNGAVQVVAGDVHVRLEPAESVEAELRIGSERPPAGWISRRFDHKQPASTVTWRSMARGTALLHTKITYK